MEQFDRLRGADTNAKSAGYYAQTGRSCLSDRDELPPFSAEIDLETANTENRRLLDAYRVPAHEKIKRWTIEYPILRAYALPAEMMGDQCDELGLKAMAQEWYRRALGIDPESEPAAKALARLGAP